MEAGEEKDAVSRRRMLKRIGAGAAVAWTAPVLTSLRAPAFAQASPVCDWSVCVGLCAATNIEGKCSDGGVPGQECMDKCSDLCGGHPPHVCECAAACDPELWEEGCNFSGSC
jgi:hypothetical protein